LQLSGKQVQKRCLAFPIFPDNSNPVLFADSQIQTIYKPGTFRLKGKRDVFCLDQPFSCKW
jgi:hypothetical protein